MFHNEKTKAKEIQLTCKCLNYSTNQYLNTYPNKISKNYQLGKHIARELLHFPDQQLTRKQIQQFLGIINHIRDFIPHVDHHTNQLSAILKKKPPKWNDDHTLAVTALKKIAKNPPPIKLITDGKWILQTDAIDESWGAILLEEIKWQRKLYCLC